MNHKQRQLVLFSNRRRAKKHLPSRVVTVRTSSRVPHETRPEVRGPIHVVWRIRRGLPDLRTPRGLRRLEGAFRKGKERDGFALLHYSNPARSPPPNRRGEEQTEAVEGAAGSRDPAREVAEFAVASQEGRRVRGAVLRGGTPEPAADLEDDPLRLEQRPQARIVDGEGTA